MAKAPAKSKTTAKPEPQPAVMAAGASLENAEEGRGSPPADKPDPQDKAVDTGEGSRNESGQFTGNPPSLEEKVDAIVDLLEKNGMSLGHTLSHGRG